MISSKYSLCNIAPEIIDPIRHYLRPQQLSKLSETTQQFCIQFRGATWHSICVYNPKISTYIDTGRYRYVTRDSFLRDFYDSDEWSPSHSVFHVIIDTMVLTDKLSLGQLREVLKTFRNLKTVRIHTGNVVTAPIYMLKIPDHYVQNLQYLGKLSKGNISTLKVPYVHNTMASSAPFLRSSYFTLNSYLSVSELGPQLFPNLTTIYWYPNIRYTDVAHSPQYINPYKYFSELPALTTLITNHYSVESMRALKLLPKGLKHLELVLTFANFDHEAEEHYQYSRVNIIPQITALVLRPGSMRPFEILSVFEKYKFPNLKFADVSSGCNSLFFNPNLLPTSFCRLNFGGMSYGDTCFLDPTNLTHVSVLLLTLSCIKSFVNHIDKFQLKNLSINLYLNLKSNKEDSDIFDTCFKELAMYFVDNSTSVDNIGEDIDNVDFSSYDIGTVETVKTIVRDPIGELNRLVTYDSHIETDEPVAQNDVIHALVLECLYLRFDRMKSLEMVELHYPSEHMSFFSPRLVPLLAHPNLKKLEFVLWKPALYWPDKTLLTEEFNQINGGVNYSAKFNTYFRKSVSVSSLEARESYILDADSYKNGIATSLLSETKLVTPLIITKKLNTEFRKLNRPLGYIPPFYDGWGEIEDREVFSVYSVENTDNGIVSK